MDDASQILLFQDAKDFYETNRRGTQKFNSTGYWISIGKYVESIKLRKRRNQHLSFVVVSYNMLERQIMP